MKAVSVVATIGALAAGVAAQRTSPLGPTNYYPAAPGILIGAANLSVICNITAFGSININNQELTAIFQIVAPNYGTFGGKSFVEGGNGRVRVPPSLTTFFGNLDIRSFKGNYSTLQINAPGTTQKVVDLAKQQALTIPNTTVTGGQELLLDIPTKGSFRVTISHDNKSPIISASIGNVVVNGTAYSPRLGGQVPTVISCPAAKQPVTIGYINVFKNVSTPVIPATNYPVVSVPKGSLVGTAGATYRCNASGIGNFNVPFWVSGFAANLSAAAGSQVAISNAHGQLNVTAALVAAIKKSNSTATAATITLRSIRFRAQNASPALSNGLKSSVTSAAFALNGTTLVDLPSGNGLLPDIPFTLANKPGQLALTFLNDAAGSINLRRGSTALKSVAFSCVAPSPEAGLFSFNIL